MRRLPLVICFCALLVNSPASANTILTFDEISVAQIDPLGVTVNGVNFTFTPGPDPGPDPHAYYNSTSGPGLGTTINLDDHVLEGSAFGVLTIGLASPTNFFKFAGALDRANASLSPGFTVNLFDPWSNLVSSTPVNTSTLVLFTEALFTYSGTAVQQAVLTFDATNGNPVAGGRFAMDNLEYAPVPEPATLSLLGIGVAGVRLLRRRQNR